MYLCRKKNWKMTEYRKSMASACGMVTRKRLVTSGLNLRAFFEAEAITQRWARWREGFDRKTSSSIVASVFYTNFCLKAFQCSANNTASIVSRGPNVPKPPDGHKWKEIRSDNTVTWLVSWTENVQSQNKYIMLNANSRIKVRKRRIGCI